MITYDGLPASSGGAHVIRGKDLLSAWGKGNAFISKISSEIVEEKYILDLYLGCKKIRKFIPQMLMKFGMISKIDFVTTKDWYLRWSLSKKSANKAVDFIFKNAPWPEYWTGPIHLYREGQFFLKDNVTDKALPNQIETYDFENNRGHKTSISNFRLNFSNKISLSTWLVLPFEEKDTKFYEYVEFLKKAAPFKISEKHWRSWSYSKNKRLKCSKLKVNLTNESNGRIR